MGIKHLRFLHLLSFFNWQWLWVSRRAWTLTGPTPEGARYVFLPLIISLFIPDWTNFWRRRISSEEMPSWSSKKWWNWVQEFTPNWWTKYVSWKLKNKMKSPTCDFTHEAFWFRFFTASSSWGRLILHNIFHLTLWLIPTCWTSWRAPTLSLLNAFNPNSPRGVHCHVWWTW